MSSVKFPLGVESELAGQLLANIRRVIGEPAAHDGRHFIVWIGIAR